MCYVKSLPKPLVQPDQSQPKNADSIEILNDADLDFSSLLTSGLIDFDLIADSNWLSPLSDSVTSFEPSQEANFSWINSANVIDSLSIPADASTIFPTPPQSENFSFAFGPFPTVNDNFVFPSLQSTPVFQPKIREFHQSPPTLHSETVVPTLDSKPPVNLQDFEAKQHKQITKPKNARKPKKHSASEDTDEEHSDEDNDNPSALKRKRNTEAARRSRARKMQRLDSLEHQVNDLIAEKSSLVMRLAVLENERVSWNARETEYASRVRLLEAQLAESHRAMLHMGLRGVDTGLPSTMCV
ncbi:hypothetical protein HK096_008689 [Nowakowskiella sp. JEL0078]|nr:hypothetical protein HK096_008689 [Nowakowskiella sp. JEL0078]